MSSGAAALESHGRCIEEYSSMLQTKMDKQTEKINSSMQFLHFNFTELNLAGKRSGFRQCIDI